MPFQTGYAVYTFSGITFTRQLDSDTYEPWIYPDAVITKDVVLGGSLVYIDIGASVAPPLSFRANCLSGTDRQQLINALGTSGTLANTRGHTDTVVLIKARPVNDGNIHDFLIDLSFELRS